MTKLRFTWDSEKAETNLICHVYREEDGTIRLISARKANNQEAPYYYR